MQLGRRRRPSEAVRGWAGGCNPGLCQRDGFGNGGESDNDFNEPTCVIAIILSNGDVAIENERLTHEVWL